MISQEEFHEEVKKATDLLIDFFQLNHIHKATALMAMSRLTSLIMDELGVDVSIIEDIMQQKTAALKSVTDKLEGWEER